MANFSPIPTVVGGVGGTHLHGLRNPRDPTTLKLVGATQPPTSTHHAPPPPPPSHPWHDGFHPQVDGRAERRLPDKEEANSCLSRNKGLPKGEGTHCTNQFQKCNTDWVYYSLARASQKLPKESEGVQGPEGSSAEQAPPPAGTQKRKATTDVVTNACPG